jgi:hypothetical protein
MVAMFGVGVGVGVGVGDGNFFLMGLLMVKCSMPGYSIEMATFAGFCISVFDAY